MLNKEPFERPNIVDVMRKLHIRPLPKESEGWEDEPP